MRNPENKLGVYVGTDALYFVETSMDIPRKTFSVALPHPQSSGSFKVSRVLPESIQLISTIQQTLKSHDINLTDINISVPTHEIIFRTFTIPWMKASEVKGVVSFEAIKYIPFALDELYYSFYPMNYNDGAVKKIRVILVAIKKETLDNYMSLFEQAGLHVNVVEPEPSSFIRALLVKRILKESDAAAIVAKGGNSGKIVVVDQGIPQFVREFQLGIFSPQSKQLPDPKQVMTRLISEARISIDYFARQDSSLKIKQVLFISANEGAEYSSQLKENLSLDVVPTDIKDFIGSSGEQHMEFLPAYGLGLIDSIKSQASFNLCPTKTKTTRSSSFAVSNDVDYKKVVMVGAACAAIFAGGFVLSGQMTGGTQSQLSELQSKLGEYKDAGQEKLKQKLDETDARLAVIKNLRLKSEASELLNVIPNLLPNGAWLKTVEMGYSDSKLTPSNPLQRVDSKKKNIKANTPEPETKAKLSLSLTGYVYSENAKEQFSLVNKLLSNLKESETFKNVFSEIDLDTIKVDRLEDNIVTFYSIKCR